jgi:toxin ParE1/3/4
MSHPVFTDEAIADLNDIHDYIAQHSPTAAARVIGEINERCDLLADNPMMGRSRPEFGRDVRSFPSGAYIIFYRPAEDSVEILRVIHGARNIEAMF